MKYCKKCFRNVREDVDICPYCGAPGLEEYGSGSSGESFNCSRPREVESNIGQEIDDLQPVQKKRDAYSTSETSPFSVLDETDTTDAYGNVIDKKDVCNKVDTDAYGSPKHSDENCDNAPDSPFTTYTKTIYTTNENSKNDMMRVEYLRMLKKIDGISPERIDELMKKYDEQHSGQEIKKISYKTVVTSNSKGEQSFGSALIATLFLIIIGLFSPIFSIIFLLLYSKTLKHNSNPRVKSLIILINIFIVIYILVMIFTVIPMLSGLSIFL